MLVSERALDLVSDADIRNDIHGSDHCPVSLSLQV
jgi:exonuclease III